MSAQFLSTIELETFGAPKPRQPSITNISARVSTQNEAFAEPVDSKYLKKGKALIVITQLCLVSIICSLTTGLITIAIPRMTTDLSLEPSLVYWPVLIYTLTAGSFVLLMGTIADVVGSRLVNLVGVFFLGIFALAMGFAQNGSQLIAFRALGGVALSMFLPTSVSLISTNIPAGKMRNSGFSFLGVGQVIGYGGGLVLGGVFVNTIGWRVGYYICGGANLALFVLGLWALPRDRMPVQHAQISVLRRLRTEIDWVGVVMASGCLGILAYVLAQISSTTSEIHKAYIATLLAISLALIPGCAFWFGYQERHNRPALVPNSIWKKLPFTTVCIMIMFVYAEMGTMEFLASLFFQQVQGLSAIQASVRILPSLVVGGILNFGTGLIVDKVPANWLVLSTTLVSAVSPLLMALINPEWVYWRAAFPAQVLFPLAVDVLFTVALLVVSEVFPEKDQALAGAIFNTIGQFGQSLGLAIVGVISNAVTQAAESNGSVSYGSAAALMKGYRAAFWTAFSWMILVCAVGVLGLRKIGKVGLKRE